MLGRGEIRHRFIFINILFKGAARGNKRPWSVMTPSELSDSMEKGKKGK